MSRPPPVTTKQYAPDLSRLDLRAAIAISDEPKMFTAAVPLLMRPRNANRVPAPIGLSAAMIGSFIFALAASELFPSAAGAAMPLSQEVYVWQRVWTPPLREAVVDHGGTFSNVVALAAEVSWNHGKPEVVRVPIDYGALTLIGRPVGLALRIGPFAGPFATNDAVAQMLGSLASSIVLEAKTNQVNVSELQLDFDCAESKLAGYQLWVEAFRKKLVPTPLTLTTLPSWLKQPAFHDLAAASDGYVLQVHSLEKPKGFDAPFTLCDPQVAVAAAVKASSFEVPFRVALPTYGYLIAFATNGQFVGLSAEGPAKSWPASAKLREVRTDPMVMAMLVQKLEAKPFPNLRGILWYRLPTIVDNLNWRWPTLGAIVNAQWPRESVRTQLRRVEAGLVEINLVNEGELDISSRLAVEIRWQDARLVAGDGLRGFELVEGDASTARLTTRSQPHRLAAGEQWTVGWLRFNRDVEVQLELKQQ
jgi:Protein of unknown function (DUF3142)